MSEAAKTKDQILDIFCSSCGAPAEYDIEKQNYHCLHCGADTGIKETVEKKREFRRLIRERVDSEKPKFLMYAANCTGCGAKIIFEENEALTDCAFCGRKLVRGDYTSAEDFPELIVPFEITEDEAKRRLLDWCKNNSRRKEAKILKKRIDELKGFYLPYILVKGPDTCEVKRQNTSRLYHCRGYIDGMFVNMSTKLDNLVLDGMEPYDLSDLREFEFSYVAGHRIKTADLKDSEAADRVAKEIAYDYEPYAAKILETRAVTIKPDTGGMMTMAVLLPAYYIRVGDVIAAVNGQTGKVAVRERKDRFLLPWQLKPIAAIISLIALTFLFTYLASRDLMTTAYVTGMLGIFFIVVVLTAYHNNYGGSSRFRLQRRIMASDDKRPYVEKPVFYEDLGGEEKPVKLVFTTPWRVICMAALALLVAFLPLVLAFIFNGFSAEGLHVAGAAVWLCIFVPVAPIYFIQYGRIGLHERPLIYAPNKKGRMRRYRKKPDLKKILSSVKAFISPLPIIVTAVVLIILTINVKLVLHWDSYGAGSDKDTASDSSQAAVTTTADE